LQGFGAVGGNAARFLSHKGVVLVGVADTRGTLHDPDGIDVQELIRIQGGRRFGARLSQGQKNSIATR
jgi:glutamate dehydrogenase (NAD(P)+)